MEKADAGGQLKCGLVFRPACQSTLLIVNRRTGNFVGSLFTPSFLLPLTRMKRNNLRELPIGAASSVCDVRSRSSDKPVWSSRLVMDRASLGSLPASMDWRVSRKNRDQREI